MTSQTQSYMWKVILGTKDVDIQKIAWRTRDISKQKNRYLLLCLSNTRVSRDRAATGLVHLTGKILTKLSSQDQKKHWHWAPNFSKHFETTSLLLFCAIQSLIARRYIKWIKTCNCVEICFCNTLLSSKHLNQSVLGRTYLNNPRRKSFVLSFIPKASTTAANASETSLHLSRRVSLSISHKSWRHLKWINDCTKDAPLPQNRQIWT